MTQMKIMVSACLLPGFPLKSAMVFVVFPGIRQATIKASSADAATCSYGIDSRSVSIYSKEGR